MSAAVASLPAQDAVAYVDRFREAEHASIKDALVKVDDMIDVLLAERDRIETSARVAHEVYGAPIDAGLVRRCAVIQKSAEFLGVIAQHKDELRSVLAPSAKPPVRRRA